MSPSICVPTPHFDLAARAALIRGGLGQRSRKKRANTKGEVVVQGGPSPRGLSFVDSDLIVSTIAAEVICPFCQIPTYPSTMGQAKQ